VQLIAEFRGSALRRPMQRSEQRVAAHECEQRRLTFFAGALRDGSHEIAADPREQRADVQKIPFVFGQDVQHARFEELCERRRRLPVGRSMQRCAGDRSAIVEHELDAGDPAAALRFDLQQLRLLCVVDAHGVYESCEFVVIERQILFIEDDDGVVQDEIVDLQLKTAARQHREMHLSGRFVEQLLQQWADDVVRQQMQIVDDEQNTARVSAEQGAEHMNALCDRVFAASVDGEQWFEFRGEGQTRFRHATHEQIDVGHAVDRDPRRIRALGARVLHERLSPEFGQRRLSVSCRSADLHQAQHRPALQPFQQSRAGDRGRAQVGKRTWHRARIINFDR